MRNADAHKECGGNGKGNGKGMAAGMAPLLEPISASERARSLPQLNGMHVGLEIHVRMAEDAMRSEPPKDNPSAYGDWLRIKRSYLDFLAADLPSMLVLLETCHAGTAVKGLSVLAEHGQEEQVRLAARLQLERSGVSLPPESSGGNSRVEPPLQGAPQVVQTSARELGEAVRALELALEAEESAAYPVSVIVSEAIGRAIEGLRGRFQDIAIQMCSDPGCDTALRALELLSEHSVSLKDKVAVGSLRRLLEMAGEGLNRPAPEASSSSLSAQGP